MVKNIYCILVSLLCIFFAVLAILDDILFLKPLILLLLGFLLTGIIGQILIGRIQRKNWEHQFKMERLNHQIKEARATYEHISHLLDKRIYRSRKLSSSFRDRDNRKINDKCANRFKDFDDILYIWNDSLNSNITKIDIYFGEKKRKFFQDEICKDLIWVGILLRRYYFNMEDKRSLEEIDKTINTTNEHIYQMNKDMLLEIKKLENKLRV